MLRKPNQCATSYSHIVANQPANQTCSMLQDENCADNLPPVCRVCLAMDVRMYHMLEHELSAIYSQITGVVVNTEDNLPRHLCWECVARLYSANDFKVKALRTHRMLSNKITSGRFLTLSDITSIDRAQHRLVSRLSNNLIENDNKCFNFIEHSTESNVMKETLSDLESNNYKRDYADKEICKPEEKIKVEICISGDVINEETDTVKRELLDRYDEQSKSFNNTSSKEKNTIIIKQENEEMLIANQSSNDVMEDVHFSKNPLQDSFKQQFANGTQGRKKSEIEERLTNDKNNSEDSIEGTNAIEASRSELVEIRNISESDDSHAASDTCTGGGYVNTTQATDSGFFNCIHCPYKSRSRDLLNKHINSKHTRTYKICSYCSYRTHLKADLVKHINSRHTKQTSYNCSYCSYKAYQKSNLSRHVNSQHTKSTCYYCSHCSYDSYSKAALKKHKITKHTKTKSN